MRLSFLLIGVMVLASCSPEEGEGPEPVVDVKVARAERRDVRIAVDAPATIFPRSQAKIGSKITAPIRNLAVGKGDHVRKGQLLAELEDRDLVAQKAQSEAAVMNAKAALEKITAGTLPTDIERAKGQVATAEAALDQARKIFERRRELFRQGAIPNRDLLVSKTQLSQAETTYNVARRALELLENQSRERDIQIARSKLEQARAQVTFVEAQLEFTKIRSPFDGSVTEQFLYPGDMATPTSPIFTVADLSVAIAVAQIPEIEAADLHLNQECVFHPQDTPDAVFNGRVTVVNQAVDPARRTVETWCAIPNPDRALRAGVFGSVSITTAVVRDGIVVPIEAVLFEEGTHHGTVLLAGADHRARNKAVETGVVFNGEVQITKGLQPGELVVVQGGYGLSNGTELRWSEAETKQ